MIDTSGRFPKQNQISAITKPIRVRLSVNSALSAPKNTKKPRLPSTMGLVQHSGSGEGVGNCGTSDGSVAAPGSREDARMGASIRIIMSLVAEGVVTHRIPDV